MTTRSRSERNALGAAGAMPTASPVRRLVYLSPTYHPYRVPVFDALHRMVGDGFVVVTLRTQPTRNDRLAQQLGSFPKRTIRGRYLWLSRHHDAGRQSQTSLVLAPGLAAALRRQRPEAVIANNFSVWTLTSLLLGYPTVLFWEGTPHTERTVRPSRLALRRWMARRARAFVVNGTLATQYLVETVGAPPDRIVAGGLVPEPPPARFAGSAPRRLQPGEPVRFLFVGRLVAGKGVASLLRAAALLDEQLGAGATFTVELVGDGPERAALERQAAEAGIRHRVRFAGYAPPDAVWDHYAASHVFVLPTLQDTWALVVPEAMWMGLPVLVSKYAGSAPDLVREGVNGHIFDPEDPAELARLMASYVATPRRIEEHGRESVRLVAPYTPENAARAYLQAVRLAVRP
ncbi:MAG: glycosyltransferase family 4 protein [Sphaerobacter sp.]|nr:glycosyltransferase family 4 protein [Sphaerobacter sp.]